MDEDKEKKLISRQIQNDINHIVSQIRKHSSPKILTALYGELETLAEYVSSVDLDVEFPDIYVFDSEKFDKIFDTYYDRLQSHYESLFKENKIISYNVNKLFIENGSSSYSSRFHTTVNPWELAKDFLEYFDKDIFDYYTLEVNKGNYFDWLIEPTTLGITMNLSSCNKSYVMINNMLEENVLKASVIVHETIHSYIAKLSKNNSYEEEDLDRINALHEVYPIFAQLVFVDWLKKVRFKEYDIRSLDRFFKNNLIEFADSFSDNLYAAEAFFDEKVLDGYYQNEGELENLENAIETSEFLKGLNIEVSADDLLEHPDMVQLEFGDPENVFANSLASLVESDKYFYGYYLSYFFLEHFREDPNKAKDLITRFTLDASKKKKIELLDGYGLGLDRLKEPKNIKKLIYTKDYYR